MVVSGVNFIFVKKSQISWGTFVKNSIIGISSDKNSCLYDFRKYDARSIVSANVGLNYGVCEVRKLHYLFNDNLITS